MDVHELNRSEARDRLEDQVFDLVTFFARRSFLPKLASAKIKRLQELVEVDKVLDLGIEKAVRRNVLEDKGAEIFSKADSLSAVIRIYHLEEAQIRMNLANTSAPSIGIRLYTQWIDLFNEYALRYVSMYETSAYAKSSEDVKISVQIDVVQLVSELMNDQSEKPMVHVEYNRLRMISAS